LVCRLIATMRMTRFGKHGAVETPWQRRYVSRFSSGKPPSAHIARQLKHDQRLE